MCFHENNLVCCFSGGPCIGPAKCANYLSKTTGDEKIRQGYKFDMIKMKFVKVNLNEGVNHGSRKVR